MESKIEQLRDILQRPSTTTAVSPAEARRIALHHAHLLQHRKDLEREILDTIIQLSEYPRSQPDQTTTRPYHLSSSPSSAVASSADQDDFRTRVRLFQPSDYDDLVEERNVNGLCGYTLCGRPRPHDDGAGDKWTITRAGDIVRRRDRMRWCSEACARRAMYVRVQLVETPAWERVGVPDICIDLLEDGGGGGDRGDGSEGEMRRKREDDLKSLAEERGGLGERVTVTIREKEAQRLGMGGEGVKVEDEKSDGHMVIEGHRARQ